MEILLSKVTQFKKLHPQPVINNNQDLISADINMFKDEPKSPRSPRILYKRKVKEDSTGSPKHLVPRITTQIPKQRDDNLFRNSLQAFTQNAFKLDHSKQNATVGINLNGSVDLTHSFEVINYRTSEQKHETKRNGLMKSLEQSGQKQKGFMPIGNRRFKNLGKVSRPNDNGFFCFISPKTAVLKASTVRNSQPKSINQISIDINQSGEIKKKKKDKKETRFDSMKVVEAFCSEDKSVQ